MKYKDYRIQYKEIKGNVLYPEDRNVPCLVRDNLTIPLIHYLPERSWDQLDLIVNIQVTPKINHEYHIGNYSEIMSMDFRMSSQMESKALEDINYWNQEVDNWKISTKYDTWIDEEGQGQITNIIRAKHGTLGELDKVPEAKDVEESLFYIRLEYWKQIHAREWYEKAEVIWLNQYSSYLDKAIEDEGKLHHQKEQLLSSNVK
jgi:hypothetical protein